MRGASAEGGEGWGACKRYSAWPAVRHAVSASVSALETTTTFHPLRRGHLGSPVPMFFCSPNEGFCSATSPLLPGHFGNLCSTSYSQQQRGARDGTKGLIWGPLRCNQMRLLRGEEKEEGGVLCSVVHSTAALLLFFVFVRADFDAVSPYLCSPGSHVS